MLGLLRVSSWVKIHWFVIVAGVLGATEEGEGALRREWGLGGEVRDESVGGEGTGGGTSRRREGDLEVDLGWLLMLLLLALALTLALVLLLLAGIMGG